MKIGCFCKHDVALKTVEALLENGYQPCFVVVQKRFFDGEWYRQLERLCEIEEISFYQVNGIREQENIEKIRIAAPDLIVSVMYTELIPQEIIDIPKRGIINHHPSLLPAYRGPHPVNWAVINGETKTGLTVHYMNAGVDTGDMILQMEVPIQLEDSITSVSQKIMALVPDAAIEVVRQIENGCAKTTPQIEDASSYYPRRTEKDDIVDWSRPAKQIYDLIRGLYVPLPGAISWLNGVKIVLRKAVFLKSDPSGSCVTGEVIAMDRESVTVTTGDGHLRVLEVDLNGRDGLSAGALSLGKFSKIGDRFSNG